VHPHAPCHPSTPSACHSSSAVGTSQPFERGGPTQRARIQRLHCRLLDSLPNPPAD
jgi:hypothetical protein